MKEPETPKTKPEKKPRPGKASKKSKLPRRRAPILLELTYTLFMLMVIGTGVSTALLSLLAGADTLMVVVRTGAAVLSVGFILWVVYWLMATSIIEARRQQVIEEAAKQRAAAEKVQSTMEFEA
jgi:hypothetical protein